MGLIVQPIIGHYSDNTWGRFGRRKPYFLAGALLASIGLILMPQAEIFIAFMPALWVGAGMLMIMDASFNVAMEPFRALVGDNLRADQHTLGFSVQTALIGIGAVVGSWLPYVLNKWFGISNLATETSAIPQNLIYSFIIGALILVGSILITIFTTKEYSPEELEQFDRVNAKNPHDVETVKTSVKLSDIFTDFAKMPETMRQLSWVQFFSWFGLFGMWVFSTPAIAQHIYGLSIDDTKSAEFQSAGDWVGIIFGVYNLVSAIVAFALPYIAKQIGRRKTHALSLVLGGIGLISMYFMPNKEALIFSMILVGFAWASILAMPYAILAGSIHPKKMGVYMGIFNFFIVIPQIVNALIGGPLVKYVYSDHAIYAIVMSGISFLIAAFLVIKVKDNVDTK
jgi:maltose/moltooligosaccharide transporter